MGTTTTTKRASAVRARARRGAAADDEALRGDADYQAWLDARVAAALEAQDDDELAARRWGPEPEFMLKATGS